MKIINAGISGKDNLPANEFRIEDLPLSPDWINALEKLCPTDALKPIQAKALLELVK